jgi:hypothetical protein
MDHVPEVCEFHAIVPSKKDFIQYGALISRRTMAAGIINCSKTYFQPIYDYLHRLLKKRQFLMGDETPVQVLTVGQKNWLFSDTQDGANASMLVYTIIEMAKAHNLNPYKYLNYLLEFRPTRSDGRLSTRAPASME